MVLLGFLLWVVLLFCLLLFGGAAWFLPSVGGVVVFPFPFVGVVVLLLPWVGLFFPVFSKIRVMSAKNFWFLLWIF